MGWWGWARHEWIGGMVPSQKLDKKEDNWVAAWKPSIRSCLVLNHIGSSLTQVSHTLLYITGESSPLLMEQRGPSKANFKTLRH